MSAFVGLAVFAIYIYYFVGIQNVISLISSTNLAYFALAFMVILMSVTLYSQAWRKLLAIVDVNIGSRKAFVFFWVGIFVDVLIPGGWSGDFVKAYLLSRDQDVDAGKTVASIIAMRVIIMFMTLCLLILGFFLVALNYGPQREVLVTFGVVMLSSASSIIIVTYLSFRSKATKKILRFVTLLINFVKRGKWKSDSFQSKAEKTLSAFHAGINTLRINPRALRKPITLSVLAWSFEISAWFLIFASLGEIVPVDKVLIVYSVVGNLQTQGVSFVGFAEVATGTLYILLGVSPAVSITATLLMGITVFWFKLLVAFVAFQCVVSSRCISFGWTHALVFFRKPEGRDDVVPETCHDRAKQTS